MAIFVNYYQSQSGVVRGVSVYTAMMAKKMRSHNVSVLNVSWQKQRFIPTPISKYLTFPYQRLAKQSRASLIHLPGPFNPGCLTFNSKVVTTFHDQVNYDFYTQPTRGQSLLRRLESLAAARADYVITPSHFTAERTIARFPKFEGKIEVIYPGVEDVFFETRSVAECDRTFKKLAIAPTTSFILFVGAASPHKNHKRVVEAYAKLRRLHPELKLIMVGNIRKRREFPALLQQLKEQQISPGTDVIIPKQKLSSRDLSALYQKAKTFLFPSLYEGWGIVVGEAFASGTPTVISDIPVFQECFASGALMVDPNSVDAMVAGVDALLTTPALAAHYQQKGYELIKHRTWENTAKKTVSVYKKLSR